MNEERREKINAGIGIGILSLAAIVVVAVGIMQLPKLFAKPAVEESDVVVTEEQQPKAVDVESYHIKPIVAIKPVAKEVKKEAVVEKKDEASDEKANDAAMINDEVVPVVKEVKKAIEAPTVVEKDVSKEATVIETKKEAVVLPKKKAPKPAPPKAEEVAKEETKPAEAPKPAQPVVDDDWDLGEVIVEVRDDGGVYQDGSDGSGSWVCGTGEKF